MSARDRLGEIRCALRPSERFADVAPHGGAHQPSKHGAVFIGASDLEILSTALALFIVDAGKRVSDEPEQAKAIRAREMMDGVDDELYALSHAE